MEISGVWPNQRVRKRFHGKGITVVLPELILASSTIHGLGLFSAHDMAEGCYVTEYGGEYVTKTVALRMIEDGTDTHLLSIARAQFMSIDGRVRGQFTEDWYCSHHKVGAMANTSPDTAKRNVKFVELHFPESQSYVQPYDWERSSKSWGCAGFNVRVFIVTTKVVKRGEEIIVDYGETYYE